MKKRQKDYLIFFGIFILAILIYSNWITMHYASDTYNIMNVGYETYATNWSLKDGRLIMYLITMICAKLNISIEIYVIGTLLGALLISAGCVIKLKNIVLANTEYSLKKEILVVIASFFTIFNFMYIENLYFAEASIMATAVYLSIVAANQLLNLEKHNMIKSLMILLIAIFSYNAVINVYITSVVFLLIIDKNSRTKKETAKLFLSACTICLITIVLNFAQIKCICNGLGLLQNRISSQTNYFTNIAYIFLNCGDVLISTANLFPKYYFIAFLIASRSSP